jgi:hypothetical protein
MSNIHALSGIQTHDHSVRASEDSSCLRPLAYRDRLLKGYYYYYGSIAFCWALAAFFQFLDHIRSR